MKYFLLYFPVCTKCTNHEFINTYILNLANLREKRLSWDRRIHAWFQVRIMHRVACGWEGWRLCYLSHVTPLPPPLPSRRRKASVAGHAEHFAEVVFMLSMFLWIHFYFLWKLIVTYISVSTWIAIINIKVSINSSLLLIMFKTMKPSDVYIDILHLKFCCIDTSCILPNHVAFKRSGNICDVLGEGTLGEREWGSSGDAGIILQSLLIRYAWNVYKIF